jgi:hypothetical protein
MEKKAVNLTWSQIIEWVVFLSILISSFVANQVDIQYLKQQNKERKEEIERLMEDQKEAGKQAAEMNGKLTQIYNDVTIIKEAVINNSLNPDHR